MIRKYMGFKTSETLLGIETANPYSYIQKESGELQNLWNPFRDWNYAAAAAAAAAAASQASKPLKPF